MSRDKLLSVEQLTDSRGRPLTQGLFLEIGYNTEFAQYSLKDRDHHYQGKVYPSLKRLYLATEDPTEYTFATEYFLGWEQWQRIANNKVFAKYIKNWREELELKLRSQAVKDIINFSEGDKGFMAAKWLADKGWSKRAAGRPSKEELEKQAAIQKRIDEDFDGDVVRLFGDN